MNRPVFIDIYRGDPVLDFPATKAAGIIGVIHKATENTGWTDTLYNHRREWWMQGGAIAVKDLDGTDIEVNPLWGAYHFLHGGNPGAEARHFVSVAAPDSNTCMVVDWEQVPGGEAASAAACAEFILEVEQAIGRKVAIYSGNAAKERISGASPFFGARRLWLAQYGARYTTQESWGKPWAWQNNGDAWGPGPHHIPGIAGLCDNNTIVDGTIAAFVPAWSGGQAAPMVVPPPRTGKVYTDIIATEFGGPDDRQQSAYGGAVDGDKPGCALPYRFPGARPGVRVHLADKSVDVEIVDVGPHNINDPYWVTSSRPRAESQRGNHAGIDLTPAAMNALGVPGPVDTRTVTLNWEFIA